MVVDQSDYSISTIIFIAGGGGGKEESHDLIEWRRDIAMGCLFKLYLVYVNA